MHPTHAPPPSSLSNWDEFLAAFVIAILYKLVPTLTFFRVSDAFTWAGDAGGVQIWSFLTLPVWGQFSLGRSYKKYPASGGAKICGAWEYLIAPASQSKLVFFFSEILRPSKYFRFVQNLEPDSWPIVGVFKEAVSRNLLHFLISWIELT